MSAHFQQVFDAETERVRALLRRVAAEDSFREAIGWQNPSALTTGIDFLLRQPPARRDSEVRKNEPLPAPRREA